MTTKIVTFPDNNLDRQIYNLCEDVAYLKAAGEGVSAFAADGVVDDTANFQNLIDNSSGRIILPFGKIRITSRLKFQGRRGGWIIQGQGAGAYTSVNPAEAYGTVLIWDGDPNDSMFEFGDTTPLFIQGVVNTYEHAQFNNTVKDLSIILNKGIKSVFYVHDQDSFQARHLVIDGFNNVDVRGCFDFRGTVGNIRCEQITLFNMPNGYGYRLGDGSSNNRFDQVFVEGIGLGFWISDTKTYEDPYQNNNITIDDSTFEGLYGDGKFVVSSLVGTTQAGVTTIEVASSSGVSENDPIYLGRGANNFEMNRVLSIAGPVITLAYPLEYRHLDTEPIKFGRIGIHIGKSSDSMGRTRTVSIRRPMFDRMGCCIDAHNIEVLDIQTPFFITKQQRGLYLDGDCQNINLVNPTVLGQQLANWRLFEITGRGNVFNFNWLTGADKSGVSQPYINNQGEIDGFYIGSFSQNSGTLPPYFRGITADGADGIKLIETDGALGLKYETNGNVNFRVDPSGMIHGTELQVGTSEWGYTYVDGGGVVTCNKLVAGEVQSSNYTISTTGDIDCATLTATGAIECATLNGISMNHTAGIEFVEAVSPVGLKYTAEGNTNFTVLPTGEVDCGSVDAVGDVASGGSISATYNIAAGAELSGATLSVSGDGDVTGAFTAATVNGVDLDGSNGITLSEGVSAVGLKYTTDGNTNFQVTPGGQVQSVNAKIGMEIYGYTEIDAGGKTTGKRVEMTEIVMVNSKTALNSDGGLMVKLTNRTGASSVKGTVVTTSSSYDNAVAKITVDVPTPIGIIYEDSVADGAEVWVVVSGIAQVYFVGNTTRNDLARGFLTSDGGSYVSGQAIAEAFPAAPFATDKHFYEIGHVLESRTGAGLARVMLHFN